MFHNHADCSVCHKRTAHLLFAHGRPRTVYLQPGIDRLPRPSLKRKQKRARVPCSRVSASPQETAAAEYEAYVKEDEVANVQKAQDVKYKTKDAADLRPYLNAVFVEEAENSHFEKNSPIVFQTIFKTPGAS
jgi:hypothetical protein